MTTIVPSYTLFAPSASFRAFAILIVAEINGVDIIVNTATTDTKNNLDGADIMSLSPTGKLPILVVSANDDDTKRQRHQQQRSTTTIMTISSSTAIARYVAAIRTDTNLFGGGGTSGRHGSHQRRQVDQQRAMVDMWLDWNITELELPATVWFYPVVGYMPYHPSAHEKAKRDMEKALSVLENTLTDANNGYLLGSHLTLADIVIISTLYYPFKFVCDDQFRKPFPNVTNWYRRCVTLPAFQQVIGTSVPLCTNELLAPTATTTATSSS